MILRPSRLVLLGHPIAHSVSPLFQNAALQSLALPLHYDALDVEPHALAATFAQLAVEGAAGNVTVPHKESAFALCELRTPIAERVGAVNTFWVDARGRLTGDNTDVGGFDRWARSMLDVTQPQRIALLGAGGAAAAVLAAIEQWPRAEAVLHNRSRDRAELLARRLPVVCSVAGSSAEAIAGATCIVNATSIGLRDDAIPVDLAYASPAATILDLVYRRGSSTAWVRDARARGFHASDGLPMLIEQGALAFERWFGMEAPREVMRAAVGA